LRRRPPWRRGAQASEWGGTVVVVVVLVPSAEVAGRSRRKWVTVTGVHHVSLIVAVVAANQRRARMGTGKHHPGV